MCIRDSRFEEIMEISDRITVLRDGELVGECFKKDVDQDKLVQMMVGRTFKELIVKEETAVSYTHLDVYKRQAYDLLYQPVGNRRN